MKSLIRGIWGEVESRKSEVGRAFITPFDFEHRGTKVMATPFDFNFHWHFDFQKSEGHSSRLLILNTEAQRSWPRLLILIFIGILIFKSPE